MCMCEMQHSMFEIQGCVCDVQGCMCVCVCVCEVKNKLVVTMSSWNHTTDTLTK